jgi:hypothetical protein
VPLFITCHVAVKAYMRNRGVVALILNLCARGAEGGEWSISRRGRLCTGAGLNALEKRENPLPLPGFEPRVVRPAAHRLRHRLHGHRQLDRWSVVTVLPVPDPSFLAVAAVGTVTSLHDG